MMDSSRELASKFVKYMNKNSQKNCFLIDIQYNCPSDSADIPDSSLLELWAQAALLHEKLEKAELTLRLVDTVEMQELNHRYRGKNSPTNVLSFPVDLPKEIILKLPLLGDIVICAPVIAREAVEQHKLAHAHWAHMIIHGILHLLGYDHMTDNDAKVMEEKEKIILKNLNFANPYEEEKYE